VEFPADAADVESLSGAGDGKHGGAEAGDVHTAERAAVCRDLRGGWSSRRSVERRDGTRSDGQHARWTSRRRQSRLYRIYGGQTFAVVVFLLYLICSAFSGLTCRLKNWGMVEVGTG